MGWSVMEVDMNLIPVSTATPGQLPFTKKTCYKFSSEGKHPGLFIKVGGKLFFDMEKWEELVEEGRK